MLRKIKIIKNYKIIVNFRTISQIIHKFIQILTIMQLKGKLKFENKNLRLINRNGVKLLMKVAFTKTQSKRNKEITIIKMFY